MDRGLLFGRRHEHSPSIGSSDVCGHRPFYQPCFCAHRVGEEIRKEFFEVFPNLPSNREPLLDDLNNKRDLIAHGYISLYRDYILYQPKLSRKDIEMKLK